MDVKREIQQVCVNLSLLEMLSFGYSFFTQNSRTCTATLFQDICNLTIVQVFFFFWGGCTFCALFVGEYTEVYISFLTVYLYQAHREGQEPILSSKA